MRKLAALLLTLSLLLGPVSAAFAKDYTLDIYWIGNKDDEEIRKGVEEAVSEYVEPKIRAKVAIPVVLTGGIKKVEDAERLLEEGKADLIGVGRALLKDAYWREKG